MFVLSIFQERRWRTTGQLKLLQLKSVQTGKQKNLSMLWKTRQGKKGIFFPGLIILLTCRMQSTDLSQKNGDIKWVQSMFLPPLSLLCLNWKRGPSYIPYLTTLPRRSPRLWIYLWSRLWIAKLVCTVQPSLVLICLSKTCEFKIFNAVLVSHIIYLYCSKKWVEAPFSE